MNVMPLTATPKFTFRSLCSQWQTAFSVASAQYGMTTDFDQIRARTATLTSRETAPLDQCISDLRSRLSLSRHHPYCSLFHLFHLTELLTVRLESKTVKGDYLLSHAGLSAWNNSAATARIFTKFDTRVLFENLSRKFKFRENLTRQTRTIHYGQYTVLIISRSIFLRMTNVKQKKIVEIIKTHILCSVTSFRNSYRL